MTRPTLMISLALLTASSSVSAHTGHADSASFMAGVLHPLQGIDHLLALIAVGLLSTRLSRNASLGLPLSFLLAMCLGLGLGINALPMAGMEQAIALSLVTGGLLLLITRTLPTAFQLALTGGFALFHGFAHGVEMPAGAVLGYAMGIVMASSIVMMLSRMAILQMTGQRANVLTQVSGSAIALTGMAFLAIAA
ncbi:MAG: HupE/UreJ family protein [Hahellaceae bacterium]|nr:HupE/UreJ family protein [Hahellaceae bacterium]